MFDFNLKSFYALIFLLGCSFTTTVAARPATPVNVVEAVISEIFPTAWVSGSVISDNDSQIAAQVSGRLKSVALVGDKVSRGDVIALIDPVDIELQIKQLKANKESRERNYKFLVNEVKRKSGLTKRNLSAQTDLDQTIANRDIAKADLASAKAQLLQAEQRLAYTQIRAPFDGVVTKRLSQLGEVVNSDEGIVQLVETSNLEVRAQVPLNAYRYLTQGTSLVVSSGLGETSATVRTVVPVADIRSHLMEVRLLLNEQSKDWPVGVSVRVAVPTGATQSLLVVPRDAIVLRREGNTVFKIDGDNTAQQVPVELGVASGEMIAVTGNIAVGDKVVIRGAERLRPGQKVSIKDNNAQLISGTK